MVKKILGGLTLISSLIWFAFFLNGVDQNNYNFVILFAGIINIILIVKTKFWKENPENLAGIKTIRFLCIILNILLALTLMKVMKSEFDLDDLDDIYLSILMLFSVLMPFLYLLMVKNNNR